MTPSLPWVAMAGSIIDTVHLTNEDYVNEKLVEQLKRYFSEALARIDTLEQALHTIQHQAILGNFDDTPIYGLAQIALFGPQA